MTSIYEMYATDKKRETDGFWYAPSLVQGIEFLLARSGGSNMNYAQSLELKTRPHRQLFERLTDDTSGEVDHKALALANGFMLEAFAETVILGWKGIKDDKGKNFPYNAANSIKIMTELPDLYDELRGVAAKQANFRAKAIKADVGN